MKKLKKKDISVLINNAAITCPGLPLEELSDKKIVDMITLNMIATIKLTRRIYSFFLEKDGGTIININSIVGLEPKKDRTIYCASKFGLRGFSESLRLESKGSNIKIMDVYLSKVKTRPNDNFGMSVESIAREICTMFKRGNVERLVIDGRPEEYRINKFKEGKLVNGREYEI